MRVLVACECSGVVREAFRARGHDAWSADLKPAEDDSAHHIQIDVRKVLDKAWDLMIAHPPCQYLSSSGLHWNKRLPWREQKTAEALEFAMDLMEAPIPHIAIENPAGRIGTAIRQADQTIQPYNFNEDASKLTCLWLKRLPKLRNTGRFPGRMVEWPKGSGKMRERWSNQTDSGQNRLGPSEERSAERARTYPGIALAMASQWTEEALMPFKAGRTAQLTRVQRVREMWQRDLLDMRWRAA